MVSLNKEQSPPSSIDTWLVLDTEFVSSRAGNQPFQVAIFAYRLVNRHLVKINEFSVYVLLKHGLQLNYYAKKTTGITEAKLARYGILPADAAIQLLQFLLMYPFATTALVGWDPTNDKRMLHLLLSAEEEWSRLFPWIDISAFYLYRSEKGSLCTPSLQDACELEGLTALDYHDAEGDALATAKLLEVLLVRHGVEHVLRLKRPERKPRYRKQRNGTSTISPSPESQDKSDQ
jgi:DNA polymerase III epsilon subunit-like protein